MRIHSLHVYPIKSASGVDRSEAQVERRGLAGDRRWMIVGPDGDFLSQRSRPELARIRVAETTDGLRLSAPGQPTLFVSTPSPEAPRQRVTVWDDPVDAAVASDAACDWVSSHLDTDAVLVSMPEDALRPVDPAYATGADDVVSFADGYPLLLTSTTSLSALNERVDGPDLPMNRFRPNLVVEGADPFAEDRWKRLRVGEATFRVVKPCARCSVTTVDQDTGERPSGEHGSEPLQTLNTFRRDAETGKVYFGWNLIPETTGRVAVGEPVEVLEQRETPILAMGGGGGGS